LGLLQESRKRDITMAQRMQALRVEVANAKPGANSTIVFINGIVPMIEAAAGDKVASLALAAELKAATGEMASAVGAVPPAVGQNPPPPAASFAPTTEQRIENERLAANLRAENARLAAVGKPIPPVA
jgi:hypothetical protein